MLTVLAEKLLAAQAGLEQRSRNSVRGLCNHWGGLVWAPVKVSMLRGRENLRVGSGTLLVKEVGLYVHIYEYARTLSRLNTHWNNCSTPATSVVGIPVKEGLLFSSCRGFLGALRKGWWANELSV